MSALLSSFAAAPVGASEYLQYQPPSGSTLVGGSIDANLAADGYGYDYHAVGTAGLYEPALVDSPNDSILQCVAFVVPCSQGTDPADFSGQVSLPADQGGDFYASAACTGATGDVCNTGGSQGAWAFAQIASANFLLASKVSPQGSQFSGSALQPGARGTAHLVFTATDPGGPGIYQVGVAIDGRSVWAGTPNTNGGECVPVGTDAASGALMFDWQQPCLATEVADVPVPTVGLADGAHELTVAVVDAARNSSTVLDQTITTSNPQTTPNPSGVRAIHARFVINWHWRGRTTLLRRITVRRLPLDARIKIRCAGAHCPRLQVRSEPAAHASKLLRALDGRRFAAGDRLLITVTAPRRAVEAIRLQMRNNRVPLAALIKR
jgi:hypothetical protein